MCVFFLCLGFFVSLEVNFGIYYFQLQTFLLLFPLIPLLFLFHPSLFLFILLLLSLRRFPVHSLLSIFLFTSNLFYQHSLRPLRLRVLSSYSRTLCHNLIPPSPSVTAIYILTPTSTQPFTSNPISSVSLSSSTLSPMCPIYSPFPPSLFNPIITP